MALCPILPLMEYELLATVYEHLEKTPSKLEKTDIIAGLLRDTPDELLDIVPSLLMGRIFPDQSSLELGMGPGLLYDSICFIAGVSKDSLKDTIREEGDVGLATEKLLAKKVQSSLFLKKLEVREVYEKFEKIAFIYFTTKKARYFYSFLRMKMTSFCISAISIYT